MAGMRCAACWTLTVVSLLLAVMAPEVKAGVVVNSESDSLHYLTQFGYLQEQDPNTGALLHEDAVKKALFNFQRMAGLPLTGELDEKTKEMMNMPRCGVKDDVSISRVAKRKRRYALQGSKWAKDDLTYRITSYSNSMSKEEVDDQIHKAFQVWADVTPLTFTPKDWGPVDIEVKFVRRSHGDGNPFDGRGKTLAHAFFPQYGGDAHFDDEEFWTLQNPDGVNLFQVSTHEIGHSLGLAHSDVSSALMAPFYRGYQHTFKLDPDDVAAIQTMYGRPGKPDPPATRPITTMGPVISIPEICRNPRLDAITIAADGFTYVFQGDLYYKLNGYGVERGYPRAISEDWKDLSGPVDAALHWDNGYNYIFKGDTYYKFYNFRLIYKRKIKDGFSGVPDNIDAAFVWSGNGKTYFIKGDQYWRYSDNRVDPEYPRPMSVWNGLPENISSAIKWKNGRTYFFSGDVYYRFHDNLFRVDSGYPRDIGNWWLGCPDKEQIQQFDSLLAAKGFVDEKESDLTLQQTIHAEDSNPDEQFVVVPNSSGCRPLVSSSPLLVLSLLLATAQVWHR